MKVERNSEILFIYDAKMTNPNGDMDNENKPRMDYDTDTNLVSDVRLKRYIRDYYEAIKNEEIFVTAKAKDAKERGKQLKDTKKQHTDLIDVRLFGAVFAEKDANAHLTGPVQFNWGYSLNPVELCESTTITSSFSSGEGVGKDFRVKYSLIAFNGSINAYTAEDAKLTEEDITGFDEVIVKAIPLARTRSKVGQTPRLYIRVELSDKEKVLKDLREYLSIEYGIDNKFNVRSTEDYMLTIGKLTEYLNDKKISKVILWKDDNFQVKGWDELTRLFEGKITELSI